MEIKKSKKAYLEKRRSTFFLLGLCTVLASVLMAFEYRTYSLEIQQPSRDFVAPIPIEDEMAPISVITSPPPPPVSKDIFVLVEDKTPDLPEAPIDEKPKENFIPEPVDIPYDPGTEEKPEVENKFETIVEVMPEFPGGQKALFGFLGKNVIYPEMAFNSGIQGVVYVEFIVEKDGRITNVKVLRGIGGGCDEEAVRVIKSMPNWSAGRQQGHPVRVKYQAPIRFVLK